MDRMQELVSLLNEASKAYYMDARPLMEDYEYDKLYDELVALEQSTGRILAVSPTQRVGFEVLTSLPKVRHEKKMLSLDKTKEISRLETFLGNQEGLLSWKLDGLTIVLTYENGELLQGVTRGNGEIGEDITHNVRTFVNVPAKIPYQGRLVLRGEGVIPYARFEEINANLPDNEKYKNPRNLCSGTVRQLNSEICAARQVSLYAFTVVEAEIDFEDKKENTLSFLQEQGFTVVGSKKVTADTVAEAVKAFEVSIPQNPFASDGLVLTYNSISYGASLGQTSKFPRDSIAFKWADEMAKTRLQTIHWDTSRTGLINPVAVFDPVELEGSTVSRASVHNVSILEDLALGEGDELLVYKANMIIPQIAENLTRSGTVKIPVSCPACGGETEIRQVLDAKSLYCTNPTCHAQRVRSLSHFVSRDAMNIEGLSEETIKKFVDAGFLNHYTDIFTLQNHKDAIETMEGFGEKSCTNLLAAIEKAKDVFLPNFIYALGLDQVGLANAKLLCRAFDDDIEKIVSATEDDLLSIDGFGSVIAHSILSYFRNEEHLALLHTALGFLRFKASEQTGDALKGLTFVITGDVHHFANRKELQAKIESLGGKVSSSVSAKTSYLINNDSTSNSSKNKKARELSIPILTEEDFMAQFL